MSIHPYDLLPHLHTVGVLMAMLVVVNVVVPFRYRWREEMSALSLLNRQIFQAHNFFIVVTLALFSALFLTCSDVLLEPTRLSRAILIGLTIFWTLRMLMQWCFYSPRIWRGNRFNTVMHCAFSVLWIYVTATCATALWSNLSRTP